MHIDSFFACANSSLEDAEFVIFGIPYDSSQSFRCGSRFAPHAIRVASWNLENYSLFFDYELEFAKICDAGNVNVDGSFEDVIENTLSFLERVDINRQIPIALGGEHTITYAVVKALKSKVKLEDVCYVVFDAHLDLREEFDGSKFNHACTTRRIYELGVGKVIQIGARSCTKEELLFAKENGFVICTPWNFSIDNLREIDEIIGDRKVYLSIDMDAFDPAFAPGVSTPEPFGLNPLIVLEFLRKFADKIFAMDVVEVVPDENYITPMLSAKLIFEFISAKKSIGSVSQ